MIAVRISMQAQDDLRKLPAGFFIAEWYLKFYKKLSECIKMISSCVLCVHNDTVVSVRAKPAQSITQSAQRKCCINFLKLFLDSSCGKEVIPIPAIVCASHCLQF